MSGRSWGTLAGMGAGLASAIFIISSVLGYLGEPPIYTIKQEYRPTLDQSQYWIYRDGRLIGLAPTLEEARRRMIKAREIGPGKVVETVR